MPSYEGGASAEAPAAVEKDPHTKLQEVLDYLSMSFDPKGTYSGTAVFDISEAPTNPHIVFWIKCDPSNAGAPVTTGFGVPPDGKYRVYTTMSRDDFFYLYSGRAGPGAVTSMVLAGRIKVRWMKFADLGSFASSFVYSTPQWIAYYTRYGQEEEARRLVLSQWEKARASAGSGTPLVVDARGELIPRASVGEEAALALERAGRLYLREEVEDMPTPAAVEEQVAKARAEAEAAGGEEAAVEGAEAAAPASAEAPAPGAEAEAPLAAEAAVEAESTAVAEPSVSDVEAAAPGAIESTPAAGAETPAAEVEAAASADTAVESAVPAGGDEVAAAGVEAAPAPAAEAAAVEVPVAEAAAEAQTDAAEVPAAAEPETAAAAAPAAAVEVTTAADVLVVTPAEETSEVAAAPVEAVAAAAEAVPATLDSDAAASSPLPPAVVVGAAPESVPAPLSAELEVDMMLLLPDLLAAAPLSAARAVASGLTVVAPTTAGGAVECLQTAGLTAALEPAFAAVAAAHAEAELVQAALVQLRAVKAVLGPAPQAGAGSTLETVVSSLRGGVRVVADVLTGDGGARAAQLKLVEGREWELGAREDGLRVDMRAGLDRIEGTLARVQSSVAAGAALAIIASSGFLPPTSGLGTVGSSLADSAWLCATLGGSTGPLVGLPPWVAAVLAHTSRRCADLKPAACSPAAQLASVAALAGVEWAPLLSLPPPLPPLPAALVASLGAAVRAAQGAEVGAVSGQSGVVQGFGAEEAALSARLHALRRRVASAPRAPPAGPPSLPHAEPPPEAKKGSSWLGGGWLGMGGILAGGGSVLGTARAEGEAEGGSAPPPLPPLSTETDALPPAAEAAPAEAAPPFSSAPEAEEAWEGGAWESQAEEVAAGLRVAFGRHVSPLSPLPILASSLRALPPRTVRVTSWPALDGGPLLLPALSWWASLLPAAVTTTATSALLSSLHARVIRTPASAWAVPDARHAETLAWCLGAAPLSPFSKPPVTYGAVGTTGTAGGEGEEEGDTHVTLLPLWRPSRLAASRRGEGRRRGSSPPSPLDAVLSVTNVMSPWRSKVLAPGTQPPAVYNGLGSGLYAATARERVRMQFEGALSDAAGDVARGSSGGDGSVAVSFGASRGGHRGMRVLLRRGVSVDDEASFKYGQADESLQAVGPPVSTLLEAPAASLRALVERIRAGGLLKVYARSNPLSVYTADRGEGVQRPPPDGGGSPAPPPE